ncbi:MAG: rod shape-determining protein MreC [bacterium]
MKKFLICFVVSIFIGGMYYFWAVPYYMRTVFSIHTPSHFFIPYMDLRNRITDLETENNDLKNQLFNQVLRTGLSVEVYSSYPFNQLRDIVIDSGFEENAKIGMYVTYGGTVFIGKVIEVQQHTSIVHTIFDDNWEMPVRIGESEVDGLFHGGNTLIVDLIPRDASIIEGDMVVTASSEFPYGLEIGRVQDIIEILGEPFKKVTVAPPIRLGELRNVQIH